MGTYAVTVEGKKIGAQHHWKLPDFFVLLNHHSIVAYFFD